MLNRSTDRNEAEAHQALTLLIKQEADRHGVLSFARFMELALYAPDLGYYERTRNVIGRSGDFFTSVSVGRLFGELLACQFAEWIKKTPAKQPVIVEAGAHDGQLALDVLSALESADAGLCERIAYLILEPSESRREWQTAKLSRFSNKVRWFHSWTDLSSFRDESMEPLTGVTFANELLDALPHHQIRWNKSKHIWEEWGVGWCEGEFVRQTMPLSAPVTRYVKLLAEIATDQSSELLWPNIPEQLLQALPDGFITEVSPAALDWWGESSRSFSRGWFLALDYGLTGTEFFTPARAAGTIRGYRNHQMVDSLLHTPGANDITASVNFSAIQRIGESNGLVTERFESQANFLSRIMQERWLQHGRSLDAKQAREFQTLTHPEHLGTRFRVLVQSRRLSGES